MIVTRDRVRIETDLDHPPAKVWRAISQAEYLAEWVMPNDFKAQIGQEFTFQVNLEGKDVQGWDGRVHCQMLDMIEGEMLRYRWATRGPGGIDTVLTMRLTPRPGGTLLVIEQEGFAEATVQNRNGAAHGWQHMAGKLGEVLARLPA